MPRCHAETRLSRQCANRSQTGSRFCSVHKENVDWWRLSMTAAGTVIGNIIVPGIGGAALGAVTGNIADQWYLEEAKLKTKAFVSFDFDQDKFLKDAIIGQAKNPDSPFEIINWSLNEPAPEREWKKKARARIKQADVVLVLVGTETHKASGVLAEIAIAREEGIPIVQIKGYEKKVCKPIPNAGRYYRWTWDNLKKLLR